MITAISPASQILLVFDSLVYGDEDVEASCLGCFEKLSILEASDAFVAGRLAIDPRKRMTQAFIETFIK